MNLHIETENGQAKNHPAFEDNLIEAFGSIPENWEPFARVERPVPDAHQVLVSEQPSYEKVNGVWTDVWAIRDMTEEEKTIKQQELEAATVAGKPAVQQAVKDFWATLPNRENFSAWTFDEETCQYLPPTPRPTEGDFRWDGATNSWVPRT
jgi:hypothetical protein